MSLGWALRAQLGSLGGRGHGWGPQVLLPQQSLLSCCPPSSPPNGPLGYRLVAAKLTTGEVVRAGTLHPIPMAMPLGSEPHPRPFWVSASSSEWGGGGRGGPLRTQEGSSSLESLLACSTYPSPTISRKYLSSESTWGWGEGDGRHQKGHQWQVA